MANADLIKPIDAKLSRAKTQSEGLRNKTNIWCSENEIKTVCQIKDDRLGFKIVVADLGNQETLEELGLLAGEFIHNLRSLLDNLAFALARIKMDPPKNEKNIYFPVFLSEVDFLKAKAKFQDQFPLEVVKVLELIQPFQRAKPEIAGNPETDILTFITWFDNANKHRVPIEVSAIPTGDIQNTNHIEFDTEEDAKLNGPPQAEFFGYEVKKGSVLMDYKTNKPLEKVSSNLKYALSLSLKGPAGADSIDHASTQYFNYTSMIVDQFRKFFVD